MLLVDERMNDRYRFLDVQVSLLSRIEEWYRVPTRMIEIEEDENYMQVAV